MNHRIEAIDYLRGISILAIIIIHVIAWHDRLIVTEYTKNLFLFGLRDFLQFSVVAMVVCSGFSLFFRHKDLEMSSKSIFAFYWRRIKRLMFPWWIFLIIFFGIHALIYLIFNVQFIDLTKKYMLQSFFTPLGVGIGWLILLMLVLMVLFPFLKYIYEKSNKIILFVSFFAVSMFLYYLGYSVFDFSPGNLFTAIPSAPLLIIGIVSFFASWSFIYMIGFLLGDLYNKRDQIKKELKLTYVFILSFIIIFVIYQLFGLNSQLYLNKYPPSAYYIIFSLMMLFVLLTIFFKYKDFIHRNIQRFLTFFSDNSFWFFMWNILCISLITPFLLLFPFGNIYIKLIIDIILNIIAVILIVKLQKLIKIEIHREKHHF